MADLQKPFQQFCDLQNRRQFIRRAGIGLGAAAVSSMATPASTAAPTGYHHQPKAKRVIFLFMAGAPSQLDLFDYKPNLEKLHGQPLPAEISKGQRVTTMTRGKKQFICASIFKFAQFGESGLYMNEILPRLSTMVDDICDLVLFGCLRLRRGKSRARGSHPSGISVTSVPPASGR